MEGCRIHILVSVSLMLMFPVVYGWGVDGHLITCTIAQTMFSNATTDAVNNLLPDYADGDLASLCSWADQIRFHYRWSAALHFIDTPEVCNYNYARDCHDEAGNKNRCVAGAINNYTSQLLGYGNDSTQYNLTEALLFLSHFVGDIHQPLHTAFESDKGGNLIDVYWYTQETNLHHVWDDSIIESEEDDYYGEDVNGLINAIQGNITSEYADQVPGWEICSNNKTACPDVYASEGILYACNWAYKNATEGTTLGDDYFLSRLPIVNLRLAQGGVRLAATLNRIFG
ncbi:S1-P1_nuclease domain-containing protein [Cephalotus follicularis]|uniref:Aspergillus nuclease S1 n=1 Tax=Cephalotus follicularis TaxID=3775 RepID=A0A1Q3BEL7_CEPFO|nr:S1-P1_nuclease domain-containing protein [Cephalotus follicularis]